MGCCFLIFLILWTQQACTPKKLSREEQISQRLDSLRQELSEIKKKKIELVMNHYHQQELFNGNVLVVENGKQLYQKSYGFADFRDQKPLTSQSVFQIGTLSQQFTAVLVLMLVEEKRIKLEDPVYYYVKGWPYKNTTLYQLLTHSSGIPDYITYFYSLPGDLYTYANNQNIINWVIKEKPDLHFESGTNWDFSHTNYVVLAEIIEYISKKKFPELLKTKILEPLNLQHTYLFTVNDQKTEISERVFGFQPDNQTLYDDNFLNKIYGDRGMYSTLEDLYLWDQALYGEELLSQQTLKKAFNPVELSNGLIYSYGMGWYIDNQDNALFQMSAWLGFKCLLLRVPTKKHTIIVMSNNVNPVFGEIKKTLLSILSNRRYQTPGL